MVERMLFNLVVSFLAACTTCSRIQQKILQMSLEMNATIPGKEMWNLVAYDGSSCPLTCGGIPVEELRRSNDIIPPPDGCADKKQTMPECPLEGGQVSQAGGHAGSFHVLTRNRVAKLSEAFETRIEAKHKLRGEVEFQAYMEMWCLSRLKERRLGAEMPEVKTHPLLGFVDERQLAPEAFGMCRVGTQVYLVMENLMGGFVNPCILDLKLGFQTAEPDEIVTLEGGGWSQYPKLIGVRMMARPSGHATPGVRMSGAKIHNAWKGSIWKLGKMESRPKNFMSKVIEDPGHRFDKALIQALLARNEEMKALWKASGDGFRSVGLSSLMVHECSAVGKSVVIEGLRVEKDGPGLLVGDGNQSGMVVVAGIGISPQESLVPNSPKENDKRSIFSKPLLATDRIALSSHPEWPTSFDLRRQVSVDGNSAAPPVEELEILVKGKGGGETPDEFVLLGKAKVIGPLEDGQHCTVLKTRNDKAAPPPRICFELRTSPSVATVPTMPVVKLIDFAHFYKKDSMRGRQWGGESDGVLDGLRTISKVLKTYL